ncbi:hypothetical protein NECAME_18567, partial [Necator americanus]
SQMSGGTPAILHSCEQTFPRRCPLFLRKRSQGQWEQCPTTVIGPKRDWQAGCVYSIAGC